MIRIMRAAIAFFFVSAASHAQGGCETHLLKVSRVGEIIDGHTLRLADASEIRLIGALSPQTPRWWKGDGVWPPARRAHEALKTLIGENKVELRFASGEARRDRHERFLAQVYVLRGEERIWVQGRMISHGFARAYSLKGHRACARALQAKERAARAGARGLWRKGVFSLTRAANVTALSKRRGSYQLVEGTIRAVGRKSQWTFLNFDADWRKDFTVAVRAGDRQGFKGSDILLEELMGKKVRVRGWVERWNGPVIKVSHPEQIEVLEQSGASAQPQR